MLYSKRAIGILSLLLTPFFGSFLFAANLRDIGKPSLGPAFVLGSLFFSGLLKRIFPDTNPFILLALNNIIGSAFYFYFFDKFFGEYEFKEKNFWPPVVFAISLLAFLLLAIYLKNYFSSHYY